MSQHTETKDDRTARYAARLDSKLATLANDAERVKFCSRELSKWDERYISFQFDARNPSIDAPAGSPTADDFLRTILEVQKRKTALEAKAVLS